MFIKKVKKKNGRTKKTYEYLYLVESVRTQNGPRQRLILNLGNLDIKESQYSLLAKRIEDILTGQNTFEEIDETIEKHARTATSKIFKKQAEEINTDREEDFQEVDMNSLEVESPRSIGAEYICHSVWNELDMNDFFKTNGVSRHVIPLLEALVVGRLVEPASERHTKTWVDDRSALYEMTGKPLRDSLNSYYRGCDTIYSLMDKLEKHLLEKERDIFSLSEKMFFFDLTNTYFEGKSLSNPKAKYGRSKEKRSDCKLVTLGLVIDETGFPKCSRLFPGNQFEGDTLIEMIENLEENLCTTATDEPSGKKRTIVIDAGIATKDNITSLKEKGYHYIAVNRNNPPFEKDFSDMTVIREDLNKGIKVEVKRFSHDGDAYVLCRSELKKAKESGIVNRVENLFLEKLEYYKTGLMLPKRTKKYRKIVEAIGRLKEKYPKAAKLYQIDVIPEKGKSAEDANLKAIDITWEKKDDHNKSREGEGSYVLRTNRMDLSDNEIWETYVMLTRIEYSFRCMKSSLGLRPVFHRIESRVDTHIFISTLAYHILNIIEYRLRAKGDRRTWATVRDVMKTHQRITISFKTKTADNTVIKQFNRVNSRVEPEHREIYRNLGLSPIPLPRNKMNTMCSDHKIE